MVTMATNHVTVISPPGDYCDEVTFLAEKMKVLETHKRPHKDKYNHNVRQYHITCIVVLVQNKVIISTS